MMIFTTKFMIAYFAWDMFECASKFKIHGTTFLAHAILSFFALFVQVASSRCRMLGFTALFAGSEVSTPFLHIRWFLIKGEHTKGRFFKEINWMCIGTFIFYRLVFLPFFVFPVFWKDSYTLEHSFNMSIYRRAFLIYSTISWSILNYYWGGLFIISQLRILFGNPKRVELGRLSSIESFVKSE